MCSYALYNTPIGEGNESFQRLCLMNFLPRGKSIAGPEAYNLTRAGGLRKISNAQMTFGGGPEFAQPT